MLKKFRGAVMCFNLEMPVLLCTGLKEYMHYKKEPYAKLCGSINECTVTSVHKIA